MNSISQLLIPFLLTLTAPESRVQFNAAPVCDDGSHAYDEYGRPNPECVLEGCAAHEAVCWPDRIDHCFDARGRDNGTCVLRDKECDTWYGCWHLYFSCIGKWECKDDRWWGCAEGTCTESPSRTA
jgi:hypothetical protein